MLTNAPQVAPVGDSAAPRELRALFEHFLPSQRARRLHFLPFARRFLHFADPQSPAIFASLAASACGVLPSRLTSTGLLHLREAAYPVRGGVPDPHPIQDGARTFGQDPPGSRQIVVVDFVLARFNVDNEILPPASQRNICPLAPVLRGEGCLWPPAK
jgi:hypothetical protein